MDDNYGVITICDNIQYIYPVPKKYDRTTDINSIESYFSRKDECCLI